MIDWSAPSALGLAGLGGGFEIGLEVNKHIAYFHLIQWFSDNSFNVHNIIDIVSCYLTQLKLPSLL